MYESSFILQFLELKYPTPPLLPPDVDGILAARRLEVLCDGVCDAVVLTFFERKRSSSAQSPKWLARQRRKIDGGIREVASLVGDREYTVSDRFSLGDIAAGTVLGYLAVRFAEFDWESLYPNLAAFKKRLDLRPSFAATVPVPQIISDKIV